MQFTVSNIQKLKKYLLGILFVAIDGLTLPVYAHVDLEGIQVIHHENHVAFEFFDKDAVHEQGSKFRYKLVGFDKSWIEVNQLSRITYSNLSAGDYVFKSQASNEQGLWDANGVSLPVKVHPRSWSGLWPYFIYVGLGSLILILPFRSYFVKLKQASRYRALLEEKVRIRTAELEKANRQLLNASVTDQLTGLHNRRYVHNVIDTHCAQIIRETEKAKHLKLNKDEIPRLYWLMFDLDGFKPINDTHGHGAGDQIICQVSRLLTTLCRKSDTVIRWGGDEFLIIGRIEHVLEVNLLAERLRQELVNHAFDIGLKQKIHLSCSIGYSLYPFSTEFPDMVSWEQVQVIADRALYHSKGAGKDHWAGIVSTEKQPHVSLINTLVTNLEQAIEEGYVTIAQTKQDNKKQIRDVINETTHAKAS